jgi:AcrR family transcriptional regulator
MTAAHGFTGFTVEQLCDEVGVSRRTFFNYFPSKEDAVVGLDEVDQTRKFTDEFSRRPSRGWPGVVDDLIELAVEHGRDAGFGSAEHADLVAAIGREPRLAARFMEMDRDRRRLLTGLVAAREGTADDDPRLGAVIEVVASVLRMAGERLLRPGADTDFETAAADALSALRQTLSPTTDEKDRS